MLGRIEGLVSRQITSEPLKVEPSLYQLSRKVVKCIGEIGGLTRVSTPPQQANVQKRPAQHLPQKIGVACRERRFLKGIVVRLLKNVRQNKN